LRRDHKEYSVQEVRDNPNLRIVGAPKSEQEARSLVSRTDFSNPILVISPRYYHGKYIEGRLAENEIGSEGFTLIRNTSAGLERVGIKYSDIASLAIPKS